MRSPQSLSERELHHRCTRAQLRASKSSSAHWFRYSFHLPIYGGSKPALDAPTKVGDRLANPVFRSANRDNLWRIAPATISPCPPSRRPWPFGQARPSSRTTGLQDTARLASCCDRNGQGRFRDLQ